MTQPLQPPKQLWPKTNLKCNKNIKKNIKKCQKVDHSLLTQTCIGTTIRIGPAIQCLPYVGFLPMTFKRTLNTGQQVYILISITLQMSSYF